MEEVKKYEKADIVFGIGNQEMLSGDAAVFLKTLDAFEVEVSSLTDELADIDETIDTFVQKCGNIADAVGQLGSVSVKLVGSEDGNKANGVIGAVALAIKGVGYGIGKIRKDRALKQYESQKDALLERKNSISRKKLPKVSSSYKRFSEGPAAQIERLYSKSFSEVTALDDKLLENKADMFRMNLFLVLKSRFLCRTMEYCIAEMKSWQSGQHDSSMSQPSVEDLISEELSSWPAKLGQGKTSWNEFVRKELKITSGEIPVPVASLFLNPCLLRNYVGVNFREVDSCPSGLIDISTFSNSRHIPLVDKNPYYLNCVDVYKTKYCPPRHVSGFGLIDMILLLILPLAFFGVLVWVFHVESSTFWRIFWILPILCWLGLGIEAVEQNFDSFFPYVRRKKRYFDEVKKYREKLTGMENMRECHIL